MVLQPLDDLFQRGIVYAPDYAINAGGLMNVAAEVAGYDEAAVTKRVHGIYDILLEIAERAKHAMQPTHRIADTIAQAQLGSAGQG